MSTAALRREAVTSRQGDLRRLRRSHRSQASQLKAATKLLDHNRTLDHLVNIQLDAANSPPPDSEEAAFLKSIDLDDGHIFSDASVPFPHIPLDSDATTRTQPNRQSPLPTGQTDSSIDVAAPAADAVEAAHLAIAAATGSSTADRYVNRPGDASENDVMSTDASMYAQKAKQQPDEAVAAPSKIAPPQREEEAHFDDATEQLLDLDSPERPAKVVRLPDEEEQAEIKDSSSQHKSDTTESTKASRNHLHAHGEAASSPSSTIGPYSAATPLPPQESPDTSPDSETGEQMEALPPKELRPSPEEQRQKEEHDRLLEAQKEIARKQAMGDVSTPDEQLRWEEREAAARSAEEQAARDDAAGPEPGKNSRGEETEAQEVVDEVMRDNEAEQSQEAAPVKDIAKPEPPPKKQPADDLQEDGDNITVVPRQKAPLTIDTSRLRNNSDANPQQASGDQDRMTTRTSSGALQKRTVSDILGQTSSQAGPSRRSANSPETSSMADLRHPHDTSTSLSASYGTPLRPSKRPGLPRTPSNVQPALANLMALKGASEDPDRDYLEPLFRIQAHDSPNVRTTSLSELVRSASKTLATEDHFMTVQERLDYRILRRIYQLQNANKWSLRQMERCKEPEQPVTHHDHMMAEMKWMRKDFKAERKMKVSVCAWLARRCADWVAASPSERKEMQVQVKAPEQKDRQAEDADEQPPELEHSGESAAEDEAGPPTPKVLPTLPRNLIVPPELSETVTKLQKAGKLNEALKSLPIIGFNGCTKPPETRSLSAVSKFVHGKVLPRSTGPRQKRSRFDYEDDAELLEDEPDSKRLRAERDLAPEDQESALFHPENKPIRDRLHANNAFRPPSEFVMPSTQFYEFRAGSQWIAEDDQRLRRLAKEYSFNWSLIADELQLPTAVKSSADRRTPWECFERWVELEQLPSEMKKTVYFKTWYQRLEQSQQAAERRYQAHVAALQASNSAQAANIPPRKKTIPSRVEKRRNTRYLWLVDAMRKGAKKREHTAFKQAEAHRNAAQRKNQTEGNQPRPNMLTPQEFSKKRYERDVQEVLARKKAHEQYVHQQRQLMAQRQAALQAAQQGGQQQQQRPATSTGVPQATAQMAQQAGMSQQGRPQVPIPTRNGHLAVPQVNGQPTPQAQMRASAMPSAQDMQRFAQANSQARYPTQQQYPMQSPGGVMQATQGSSSPSMPPPQSLSSGHVPAVLNIKSQLRAKYPQFSDEQIMTMATEALKTQNTANARQSAMNAAAGISHPSNLNAQAYAQNQNVAAYQQNPVGMAGGSAANGYDAQAMGRQQYAELMRRQTAAQQQLHMRQGSGGSPRMVVATPTNVGYGSPQQAMAAMRPPSRGGTTPGGLQRMGSAGMQSPGVPVVMGSPGGVGR